MKGRHRKQADDSFTVFVIDQLSSLGTVEARSMFGGKGLCSRPRRTSLSQRSRTFVMVRGERCVGDLSSNRGLRRAWT
jgi:TfoX/Sxy family transcriptional regulator of competence genes